MNDELYRAIKRALFDEDDEDLSKVRALIAASADVNYDNNDGYTQSTIH